MSHRPPFFADPGRLYLAAIFIGAAVGPYVDRIANVLMFWRLSRGIRKARQRRAA